MLSTQRRAGTFEQLSFNVGPTLLSWLEAHHPDVYRRILDADRTTGRAIAQAYGHAILPLCNERDVRTHVRWGILDFAHRFGRRPEGMWLPETAVNDFVLRVLAEEGIRFTILAPGRSTPTSRRAAASTAGATRTTRTATIELVVYDGRSRPRPRLRGADEPRIIDAALDLGGLVVAATDGETFGHHHKGADEIVAHALAIAEPAYGVRVPRADRPAGRVAAHHRGARAHQRLVLRPRRAAVDGRLRLPHRRARGLEPGVARSASARPRRAARLGHRGVRAPRR